MAELISEALLRDIFEFSDRLKAQIKVDIMKLYSSHLKTMNRNVTTEQLERFVKRRFDL